MNTPNTVKLDWHIVCGTMEVEELLKSGDIRVKRFTARHDLFRLMREPTLQVYTGGWGPELLHVEKIGEYIGTVGRVYCTYQRYTEIAEWFLNAMFKK